MIKLYLVISLFVFLVGFLLGFFLEPMLSVICLILGGYTIFMMLFAAVAYRVHSAVKMADKIKNNMEV